MYGCTIYKKLVEFASTIMPSTSVVNMEKIIDDVAFTNDPDITQDKACLSLLIRKTAFQEIVELPPFIGKTIF